MLRAVKATTVPGRARAGLTLDFRRRRRCVRRKTSQRDGGRARVKARSASCARDTHCFNEGHTRLAAGAPTPAVLPGGEVPTPARTCVPTSSIRRVGPLS